MMTPTHFHSPKKHHKLILSLIFLIATTVSACSSQKSEKKQDVTQTETTLTPQSPEAAKESYQKGNAALDDKEWVQAIEQYKKSISQNPEPWETYMNAAIATIMDANTIDALDLIKKSLEHGGDSHQIVYFNLGNIYQERGLYTKAIQAYRAGLAVGDPNDVDSLLNIAAAYVINSDWPNAEATYKYILSLKPNSPEALHGLAMVTAGEGNIKQAIEKYEDINVRFPGFAPAFYNKASLLLQVQRTEEAIKAYQTYLELTPYGPYNNRARNTIEQINSTR